RGLGREQWRIAVMECPRRLSGIDSENAIRLVRPFRCIAFAIPSPITQISQVLCLPRGPFIHFRVSFGLRKTIGEDTDDRSFQKKKDGLTYCLSCRIAGLINE